jgi:hypothetical protein
MPRPQAQALVTAGAARALEQQRFLIDILRETLAESSPKNQVDWASLARPESYLGQANALVDRVLARISAVTTAP